MSINDYIVKNSTNTVLTVPENTAVDAPLHLSFTEDSNLSIILKKNSRASICIDYLGGNTSQTQIQLEDGAILHYHTLQNKNADATHHGTTKITQEANSALHAFSLALGSKHAQEQIEVKHTVPDVTCTLNGLYVGNKQQHLSQSIDMHHQAPNTASNIHYKGILNDKAKTEFRGSVTVHEGAQHTDAKQSNHNLLLSKHASADSRPELEVYADDVKCAHGSTVGQLDDDALFYLQSRGIDVDTATALLTYAFATSALECIQTTSISDRYKKALFEKLPNCGKLLA
jgi:Fe-S cluster assembly protein SufD